MHHSYAYSGQPTVLKKNAIEGVCDILSIARIKAPNALENNFSYAGTGHFRFRILWIFLPFNFFNSASTFNNLGTYLRKNTVLKELWLAYNDLTAEDAYNIGNVLKSNFYLQFLDLSNNNIQVLCDYCKSINFKLDRESFSNRLNCHFVVLINIGSWYTTHSRSAN